MLDPNTLIEAGIATVTVIGGIWTTSWRLLVSYKRKKELYRLEILSQAKKEADQIKIDLEVKIKELETEFHIQRSNVSKDFEHFRQTYNNEIKTLGEKIENLREDLSQQHQSLVGLLTKLVNSK